MDPETQLKLCAIMFTALWTAWMLWSFGSFDGAHVVIMSICGSAAGYGWYRAMRWQFRRSGMLAGDDHSADFAEKR
jgi:hypothetical protein